MKPHRPSQTTVSTDRLLGAFGLTDNLQARVQHLCAEPANVPVKRLQVTFATTPTNSASPLQPDC
ncbi:MAG: hypothetical protein HC865_26135 [Cyanobacteria bacterium RU_5_0]|nr:hypothetical protein [Cyanobacteria bacterium RU_5_0]